jgi:hypothetical protein
MVNLSENAKNKITLLVVFIAIILLFFAVSIFYVSEREKEDNPPEPEENTEEENNDEEEESNDEEEEEEVIIGSGEAPVVRIACSLGNNCLPQTGCSAYQGCNFTLINSSSDPDEDIAIYKWEIKREDNEEFKELFSCNMKFDEECNYTVQSNLELGDYQVRLYAEDKAKNYSSTTKSISIVRDIRAGFECSLEGGDNPDNYRSCEEIDFSEKKVVYFRYNLPDPHERSRASEGAEIVQSLWKSGNGEWSQSGPYVLREMKEGEVIYLTVIDDKGRRNSIAHAVGKRSIPIWGN